MMAMESGNLVRLAIITIRRLGHRLSGKQTRTCSHVCIILEGDCYAGRIEYTETARLLILELE